MWTEECSKVFEQLKEYLSSPLLLSQPEEGEVCSKENDAQKCVSSNVSCVLEKC